MRASTAVIGIGAGLFALPVPGTFILGGATMAAGGVARYFDH
jgi:hypothetical protein